MVNRLPFRSSCSNPLSPSKIPAGSVVNRLPVRSSPPNPLSPSKIPAGSVVNWLWDRSIHPNPLSPSKSPTRRAPGNLPFKFSRVIPLKWATVTPRQPYLQLSSISARMAETTPVVRPQRSTRTSMVKTRLAVLALRSVAVHM